MDKFLNELQSLDERTKSRVLIMTTIIIMAIVIYFWLGYFNSIVSTNAAPALADAGQAAGGTAANGGDPTTGTPGFFQMMGSGLANMAHAFENFVQLPSKYVIKPQ